MGNIELFKMLYQFRYNIFRKSTSNYTTACYFNNITYYRVTRHYTMLSDDKNHNGKKVKPGDYIYNYYTDTIPRIL